jgi:hypothetical protein
VVGEQDLAPDPSADAARPRPGQPGGVVHGGAEAAERHPERAAGRGRGEDVAGMERPAQPDAARPVVGAVGERDRAGPGLGQAEAEEPVVGTHEVVAVGHDGEGPAGAPHARIDHGEVDRPGGEAPVGGFERERAAAHVLGRNGVGEVHEPGGGVDPEDHPLDDADVRIVQAEVAQERDDPARPGRRRPAAPRRGRAHQRSRRTTNSAINPRTSRSSEGGKPASRPVASAARSAARATA